VLPGVQVLLLLPVVVVGVVSCTLFFLLNAEEDVNNDGGDGVVVLVASYEGFQLGRSTADDADTVRCCCCCCDDEDAAASSTSIIIIMVFILLPLLDAVVILLVGVVEVAVPVIIVVIAVVANVEWGGGESEDASPWSIRSWTPPWWSSGMVEIRGTVAVAVADSSADAAAAIIMILAVEDVEMGGYDNDATFAVFSVIVARSLSWKINIIMTTNVIQLIPEDSILFFSPSKPMPMFNQNHWFDL
jgi:hypothetical protein